MAVSIVLIALIVIAGALFWWFKTCLMDLLHILMVWIRDTVLESFNSYGSRHENGYCSNSLCMSPECIRCSRNIDILSTALTRLSYYNTEDMSESENCLVEESTVNSTHISLVIDIRNSLAMAKNEQKTNTTANNTQQDTILKEDSITKLSSTAFKPSPLVFHMSGLKQQEFWPLEEFPALTTLKEKWKHVALEFQHLYKSPFAETQRLWKMNSTVNGRWEIAQIVDQGRLTKAAEFCPITADLLKQIPDFISDCYFGDASFSVVHPGTTIATHCGSTDCRVRCHIGLQVPKGGSCSLTVGSETRCWEEGEMICFNDAYPHSVQHNGAEDSGFRAVLLIDMWHPEMTSTQRHMISYSFHDS